MLNHNRASWFAMLLLGALACTLAGGAVGQEKGKKPPEKHDASVLNDTLKDVIDTGAKMFNDQGDHAGCYQLWRGSLMSIRPFVPPDMQASIDRGLSGAEKKDSFADRAFELRKILDEIRVKSKGPGKKLDDKKDEKKDEKKKDEKKKDEKKEEKKKKPKDDNVDEKGDLSGKLLLDGKPVAGGYFVTLISAKGKAFSSPIKKDGAFQFKTPIPTGDYRVVIEKIPDEKLKAPPLPTRYDSVETSNLALRVQGGAQEVELKLMK